MTAVTAVFDKAYASVLKNPVLITPMPSVVTLKEDWNPMSPITDSWDKFIAWLDKVPHNIAQFSIDLMASLYKLSTDLILKTPLWIFDNEWFHNTTYKFSLISISIVSILTILKSIKQMASKLLKRKHSAIDIKKIFKKWFLVSFALSAVPFVFLKVFQGLNFISDAINSMGMNTIESVALPDEIKLFDVLTIIAFDIILISSIVPILLRNGKRFFDIMLLGAITPFALTAWIFDPYRHLFKQWWDNLKHLSLVQIYYALFLLVLGWFLFGTPAPDSFTGMLVKMLVVIGGFARMAEPPVLVSKHLDRGEGLNEFGKKSIRSISNNVKTGAKAVKVVAGGATRMAKGIAKRIFRR